MSEPSEGSGRALSQSPTPESGPVEFMGDGRLEGLLEWPGEGSLKGGVVVAHPHPLHGATMSQPVVYRCAQACRDQGYATLRFNFRGVGRSEGSYSGWDEHRDLAAAARYLRERLGPLASGGPLPLAVVGYSFGSVMAVISAEEVRPEALVLIGFPVASDLLQDEVLDKLRVYSGPSLVVVGDGDDFAPVDLLRDRLDSLGVDSRLTVIRNTGHFFEGRQREVGEVVAAFVSRSLTSP